MVDIRGRKDEASVDSPDPHQPTEEVWRSNYVLVIHGGAGTMNREGSTPEQQLKYKRALVAALYAGHVVLRNGGEAMDAAVAAVATMEDNPLFNAGKGAVFNSAGKNELEASIMLSKPPGSHPSIPASRRGAALTLLTRAKNPSKVARLIYLNPTVAPHVFLSGSHAQDLGERLGETLVDPSYFHTERRWEEHRRGLEHPDQQARLSATVDHEDKDLEDGDLPPKGTVGAVALDIRGCISVVTSTGGRTNKLPGRIGDTPLMGAGFWAEEWLQPSDGPPRRRGVGISGTGDGDFFIRQGTASTIASRMKFLGWPLEEAAKHTIKDLYDLGGLGGIVALDENGNVAMPLNCNGMFRGVIRSDGVPKVAIFDDDILAGADY